MSYSLIGGKVIPAVTGGVFAFTRVFSTSDTLLVSPAVILAEYIRDQETMSDPGDNTDWPLYISYMPDSVDIDSDCGAIYDTTPIKDGRLMIGPVIQHYGIQIKIRSISHSIGWLKAENIITNLDAINYTLITIDGEEYQMNAVKRIGHIIPLGIELGTKDRQLFTVNFLVTLKRVI